jgi:hypothetical protein
MGASFDIDVRPLVEEPCDFNCRQGIPNEKKRAGKVQKETGTVGLVSG